MLYFILDVRSERYGLNSDKKEKKGRKFAFTTDGSRVSRIKNCVYSMFA